MYPGSDIARRARACVGVPFRPQGRDAQRGLDCIGLAGFAFGVETPRDYRLRGGDAGEVEGRIAALGLARIDAQAAREGDLLLLQAAPTQLHFAVMTADGFVHADARLRRVVETPGPPGWPIISAWRQEG
jgi:cell wall-associated NlpC family hydrolase